MEGNGALGKDVQQTVLRFGNRLGICEAGGILDGCPDFGRDLSVLLLPSQKDLGEFLGASWSAPSSTGLQSLAWRFLWEDTHDEKYKQLLLRYNREDCEAVRIVALHTHVQGLDTAEGQPAIHGTRHGTR